MKSKNSHLLIEVGVEELPVDILNVIYSELPKKIEASLKESRIESGKILVEATPRRIAVFIESVASQQKDQELEFSGPMVEQAYDAQGNPTKALEGFLRGKQASLQDVQTKETPRGKCVVIRRLEKGKASAQILAAVLSQSLMGLPFPKFMRWEKSGFRFPRPVRWLVALLGNQTLKMELAGLRAGKISRGHRFLSDQSFSILKADWELYQKLLKKYHVVLSADERKSWIRIALESRYKQDKIDAELLHTVTHLVEEPFLVEGSFDKDYLKLPAEVLATVMKKNQKIFAIYDSKGKMLPKFLAVLNGKRTNLDRIRKDFENVLESRLKDAQYFYREDTKEPFESKFQSLGQIIYLGKLGTMKDKTERMEKLAEKICTLANLPHRAKELSRAAKLSKIDLMTHLVYEMPELQGIVGGEYARVSGEKSDIAHAISTQYLPKNLSEDFLSVKRELTELGALLGILDRFDLLVGAFGSGIEPTGSQDPFALRRAGGILIKLIRAFRFHFNSHELLKENLQLFGKSLSVPEDQAQAKFKSFLQERFIFELGVQPGSRNDEIARSVIRSSFEDIADVFERYESLLHMFKEETEVFSKAVKVIERTANILKSVKSEVGAVRSEFLKEEMEIKLYQVFEQRSIEVRRALDDKRYRDATLAFAKIFHEPVNDFFSQVLVNAEDKEIRQNRHALLKQIYSLYAGRVADLSLLSRMDA